jgi:hypothetical protein
MHANDHGLVREALEALALLDFELLAEPRVGDVHLVAPPTSTASASCRTVRSVTAAGGRCKQIAGSTSHPHGSASGANSVCRIRARRGSPTPQTEESPLQSNLTLRLVLSVVQDPEPDDRGQLMLAAIVEGGQTVALTLSAN